MSLSPRERVEAIRDVLMITMIIVWLVAQLGGCCGSALPVAPDVERDASACDAGDGGCDARDLGAAPIVDLAPLRCATWPACPDR